MSAWDAAAIDTLGAADEVQVTSRREDGSSRPYVTIWAVRLGDDLYVRSAHGRDNGWFRRALAAGDGRIRGDGIEREVSFEEPGPEVDEPLHDEFHRKYDRYGSAVVDPVVSAESARATFRLLPR